MNQRIPWGIVGSTTDDPDLTDDGVLALAKTWVEEYAVETGQYPGVRGAHYALISLCAERGFEYRNTRDVYLTLSRFTAKLRRVGRFPSFEDLTRSIEVPLSFDGAERRLLSALASFRLDHTIGQPWQTYIVIEKRGLVGRVKRWTGHLGLRVVPLGGFGSETIERKLKERIADDGRPSRALVVSDFDPSGLFLPEVLQRHVGFDEVVRVALTAEQVDELDLPTDPAPAKDSRRKRFIAETGRDVQVEVDALDALHPGVLEEALLDAIEAEWDDDAYAEVLDREWREGWAVAIAHEFIQTNTRPV